MDLLLAIGGFIGMVVCFIMLVIAITRKRSPKKFVIGMALGLVLIVVGVSMPESSGQKTKSPDEIVADAESEPDPEHKPAVTPKPEKEELSFQDECEKNAEEYPAKQGAILYTKGDNHFTGTKYYFKGEIIKLDIIENTVGDPSVWLVKNENGYVMPIQHDRFAAEVGDIVEVWGALTGDGFANVEGIDNVVGQTGSMHAMMISVDGEMQY